MKKSLTLILAVCVILLTGCGDQPATTADETAPKESLAAQTLDESSAPETVVVPDVVGMDKDEAVKKLEDLGLKVVFTKEPARDTNLAKNIITTQSHTKDTVVVYGAEIELQYNSHELVIEYADNNDGTASIQLISGLADGTTLEIPSEWNGLPVTQFQCDLIVPSGVNEVIIPNSIQSIPCINAPKTTTIKIDNSKEKVWIGFTSGDVKIIYLR